MLSNYQKKIILKTISPFDPSMIGIFGSYARGTNTRHSDLDVIFVEDTRKPFLKRLDPYFNPLSKLMKGGVDVLVYTPQEFKKLKDNLFMKRAVKEGVVIFESGKL